MARHYATTTTTTTTTAATTTTTPRVTDPTDPTIVVTDPTDPTVATEHNFVDTSTGGVATEWYWNFGDGNTSTEQNPTNIYRSLGEFEVTLVAKNDYGTSTTVKTILIEQE
jgi:PKD repeat protein